MIGQTISHYKITAKLGEGGMGEVYLATDTSLDRQVALKFLPESLQKDPEARERLIREAKAASRLHHPNILTIHAVEHHEGRDFIVMEYVEGKPLTESSREAHRSIPQVLDLAIAVADGLQKAHAAGVIHRDLKPANILIDSDGVPRLVDFGLAKVRGTDKLTKTGSTLGTVAYMSPEQAMGQEIDARSDIFSFGAVLYELITGRTPFQGAHEAAITYAIINEAAEPMSRFKAGMPVELERIVAKSLAKSPAERYQSVAEMAADLRALQRVQTSSGQGFPQPRPRARKRTVAAAIVLGVAVLAVAAVLVTRHFLSAGSGKLSERKMLAVLPFENLGLPDDEYFADGITDEITGKLAAIRDLGVISRTSTMLYKHTTKNLREIARELGVGYVLEGTILWDKSRDTSHVRILPQLIRVSDDTHLWAETYERPLTGIFALQADIASRIADAMNITLLGSEHAALEAMPTRNLDAYQAYLRGVDCERGADFGLREKVSSAVRMFQRAVELDSTFALAYAHMAHAHAGMFHYGFDPTPERLAQARVAADRALALRQDLPWVHWALCYYYYWGHRDYDRAVEEITLAEVGLPDDPEILSTKAYIWRRQGKLKAAVEQMQKAFVLDPRNAALTFTIGETFMQGREYGSADKFFDRTISLSPDELTGYLLKVQNRLAWRADTAMSRAVLVSIPKPDEEAVRLRWFLLNLLERDYSKALTQLTSLPPLPEPDQMHFVPRAQFAGMVYYYMNDRDRAHACFDSARVILGKQLKERPDDHRIHSSLGVVYAGLGRKEDAIREGKLGVELFPVKKDAYIGPARVEDLALVYLMVGEYDAALDQIEYLLSIPSWVSVSLLRLDPRYDPLRNLPRFQKLLQQPDKVF